MRSGSNWHFTGHGVDLQLLEIDMPPEWELESVAQIPIPEAENWTANYNLPPDAFGTSSLIKHSITVFDQEEAAQKFLEADYQIQLELVKDIVDSIGIQQKDFIPPPEYRYKSPLADEFKVIYAPELAVPTGVLVGYSYEVWARYSNVVSHFITIVEDKDQTQIEAGEANILPWSEVERLLKIIDGRFQAAMTAQ